MIATAALVLPLAACGSNSAKETATKPVAVKVQKTNQAKVSNEDAALMAYMALNHKTIDDLSANVDLMNWENPSKNTYKIDFGGQPTTMTVSQNDVKVTYTDATTGATNATKTFTKSALIKQYKDDKSAINDLLADVKNDTAAKESSSDNAKSSKVSKATKSSTKATKTSSKSSSSSTKNDMTDEEASSMSQADKANATQTVSFAGHSWHTSKIGGTTVLVGNNGEGEVGEWLANTSELTDAQKQALLPQLQSIRASLN
ncbi:hypothetical protein [Limosilactobacillus equigenerosi]|uniref:hypothetical protein n=1 Tax=Limosilactobacillus equigenerosi TaxID=417373 RepID=UPI0006D067E3|nr:hypothetical protein [Limosilactobacillus equigenerosi]